MLCIMPSTGLCRVLRTMIAQALMNGWLWQSPDLIFSA
jgi:hypothetical protein